MNIHLIYAIPHIQITLWLTYPCTGFFSFLVEVSFCCIRMCLCVCVCLLNKHSLNVCLYYEATKFGKKKRFFKLKEKNRTQKMLRSMIKWREKINTNLVMKTEKKVLEKLHMKAIICFSSHCCLVQQTCFFFFWWKKNVNELKDYKNVFSHKNCKQDEELTEIVTGILRMIENEILEGLIDDISYFQFLFFELQGVF